MLRRLLFWLLAIAAGMAAAQQAVPVRVDAIKEEQGHRIVARNDGHVPVQITINLGKPDNVASGRAWPLVVVLHPGQSTDVARLMPADPRRGYQFGLNYAVLLGDPNARPDPLARYRMPFERGRAFPVSQAPGGRIVTHTDPQTANALDIVMPEGTPLVAARAGLVIDVFEPSATRADLAGRGNYVRIFHDDGTWADYAHLSRAEPTLALNSRVEAGTRIGWSGNTGKSSGPHLHFHVQVNQRGRVVSLPILFDDRGAGGLVPTQGMLLRAN